MRTDIEAPTITELIDAIPVDDTVREVQRDEALLHTIPDPGQMRIWKNYEPLGVVTFPMKHTPSNFSPPQGIYESDYIHIEWQKMNGRQPIYHRNTDVDEIAYQVSGNRTLISEKGSVDLEVGDFSRIPVTVAHDNRGVDDVHLIFYIPTPVSECVPASRTTEYLIPPFPGWEPGTAIELITEHLGAVGPERGSDSATFLTNEKMLLETAKTEAEPITILRASGSSEVEWLYKSQHVWLGSTTLVNSHGKVYRRHRCADEIQCQVKGSRTLVTQRGFIKLEPGDFTSIPAGCAFTSIVHEESTHLTVLTRYPTPPKPLFSKTAVQTSLELIDRARRET